VIGRRTQEVLPALGRKKEEGGTFSMTCRKRREILVVLCRHPQGREIGPRLGKSGREKRKKKEKERNRLLPHVAPFELQPSTGPGLAFVREYAVVEGKGEGSGDWHLERWPRHGGVPGRIALGLRGKPMWQSGG